jgi:hypothetical protein
LHTADPTKVVLKSLGDQHQANSQFYDTPAAFGREDDSAKNFSSWQNYKWSQLQERFGRRYPVGAS